jgi:hypothetical protein
LAKETSPAASQAALSHLQKQWRRTMNRTLTAAVALAAGLGMAGLAHAQSSAGPATTPNTVSPSTPSTQMNAPNPGENPNAMQNPGSMSRPSAGTYGAQGPQANSQNSQMNQNGQQQNPSQAEIQQAQQQLKQQGLYKGAIDGVVGPETQNALMQFQREQGLPETAQLDQQTLGRLKTGSNGGAMENNTGAANTGTTARPAGSPYPTGTQNPATPNATR